jgi:hypothetical protein
VATVLLLLIVIVSLVAHRLIIEIPIDSIMGIAPPHWILFVILLLILSWLLEDDSRIL